MEEKIAVIGAVLDNPRDTQQDFNKIVSEYKDLIRAGSVSPPG